MGTKAILATVSAGIFLVLSGPVLADPGGSSLSEFADLASLWKTPPLRGASHGLVPLLQDDGWGWGDDEKEKEPAPETPGDEGDGGDGWGWGDEGSGGGDEGGKKEGGGDGWGWGEEKPSEPAPEPEPEVPGEIPAETPSEGGDEWGGGWEEDTPPEPTPGDRRSVEDDYRKRGPSVDQARKTRIGLEFGGFLPFGEKEEAFSTGSLGGVFFGFGLPPFLGGLTVTSEIRLLAGMTSSIEQETGGYDVSSNLIFIKDDYLFHFFPRSSKFNLYYFIGLALALEMSKAEKETTSGDAESESATYTGFLVDTGLGSWIHLGGPVDLVLKIEFNLVPMSDNVPFFITGEAGLQIKF